MIDFEIYKERLEEDLALITKALQELGVHNPSLAEDWIALPVDGDIAEADENVAADRAEDIEERVATLAALETEYNDIVRALSKIEEGTYGVCEISGEEIEEERLNANPSARTCIEHMDSELDLIK
jgi:RNA polymerase-binding transcription factor DksA